MELALVHSWHSYACSQTVWLGFHPQPSSPSDASQCHVCPLRSTTRHALKSSRVGAVLYTTYLQTLAVFHEPAGRQSRRVYPPPPWYATASAGFVAGSVQSVVSIAQQGRPDLSLISTDGCSLGCLASSFHHQRYARRSV